MPYDPLREAQHRSTLVRALSSPASGWADGIMRGVQGFAAARGLRQQQLAGEQARSRDLSNLALALSNLSGRPVGVDEASGLASMGAAGFEELARRTRPPEPEARRPMVIGGQPYMYDAGTQSMKQLGGVPAEPEAPRRPVVIGGQAYLFDPASQSMKKLDGVAEAPGPADTPKPIEWGDRHYSWDAEAGGYAPTSGLPRLPKDSGGAGELRLVKGPDGNEYWVDPRNPGGEPVRALPGVSAPPADEAPGDGSGEPPRLTEAQTKALKTSEVARRNLKVLMEPGPSGRPLFESMTEPGQRVLDASVPGSYGLSADYERAATAVRNIVEAVLREATGAAAPESEVRNYTARLAPVPGDEPATIAQKWEELVGLATTAQGLIPGYEEFFGAWDFDPMSLYQSAGPAPAGGLGGLRLSPDNPFR